MCNKLRIQIVCLFIFMSGTILAQQPVIRSLNGVWQFEQTANAFPPQKYSRSIPVPGLIHLATPKIEAYDKLFLRPGKTVLKAEHNLYDIDYVPQYSWYRNEIEIPESLKSREVILCIRKSQYVTQVYINGMDAGSSMSCYTPIELNITPYLKYGQKNEILIRVGERVWLPSQAAGSTDKEKEHYLPGIWDDVSLRFTNKFQVSNALLIPDTKDSTLTAKVMIRSFYPSQLFYGSATNDSCEIKIEIFRKDNNQKVVSKKIKGIATRDNNTVFETTFAFANPRLWSPETPFLYRAEVTVSDKEIVSDCYKSDFGFRDFSIKDKHFYLNNKMIYLRGSNITLQRFFEDPECSNLVWDRKWVTKLLCDVPKSANWNAMRVCVGIVPDFWYDIADSCGLLLQNEWFYWQNHGWNEQIQKEYTEWVWADGNHPSIVIWDGINENKNLFIGNTLIPELKKLDPTRVWDAGFMEGSDMVADDMDEPHTYICAYDLMIAPDVEKYLKENPYELGNLDNFKKWYPNVPDAKSAQLVNEYGWIWLWRDGSPSKLTKKHFDYFVGPDATPQQRWELQAYWLQLETEWLRSERSIAGVLAFCLLTNNYGYTGDYFSGNIASLTPTITLKWFKHCFAPVAAFINLPDQRYFKNNKPYQPKSKLSFNLVGVNDFAVPQNGKVSILLLNSAGKEVSVQNLDIMIPAFKSTNLPVTIKLPALPGGYMILAKLSLPGKTESVISRRYIMVGDAKEYKFFDYPIK
jgi:beta-galactosidase